MVTMIVPRVTIVPRVRDCLVLSSPGFAVPARYVLCVGAQVGAGLEETVIEVEVQMMGLDVVQDEHRRHGARELAEHIEDVLRPLRMLDQASDAAGAIGSRYALAEFCDAFLAADRDRLKGLREDLAQQRVRSRSWIPVECFFQSLGLPLPAVPTEWLEPHDAVAQRWTDHLNQYVDRQTTRRIAKP